MINGLHVLTEPSTPLACRVLAAAAAGGRARLVLKAPRSPAGPALSVPFPVGSVEGVPHCPSPNLLVLLAHLFLLGGGFSLLASLGQSGSHLPTMAIPSVTGSDFSKERRRNRGEGEGIGRLGCSPLKAQGQVLKQGSVASPTFILLPRFPFCLPGLCGLSFRLTPVFSSPTHLPIRSGATFGLSNQRLPRLFFRSVQSLSRVQLFVTPMTAACLASLSITNSWSLRKLMSIESVMPSSHLILCHPLLLSPSIFPSIRVFSNESALHIRWPKYWSFSFNISPSKEHSGLISFRMDWLDLLAVQGTLKSLLQHHSSKASILWCSAFFIVQLSHPYMNTGKAIALTRWTFVGKVISLLFNMLSRLVITFLPGSKRLFISWLQSPSAVILEPPQK